MTAIETKLLNAFETTLTSQMNPTDLTAVVASTSTLTPPCYLVIEPEVAARREYVLFDSPFTATNFVASAIGKRYLTGSAAASGLTHPVGSVVRMAPLAQHIEDLHDRIDAIDHGTLAGLGDDDHAQYLRADGTRAVTAVMVGVTPTLASHLATKGYSDGYADLLVPIGSMREWPFSAAPNSKWVIANGQAILKATYPTYDALAAADGYPHGSTATHVNVPNMVGRFALGKTAAGTGSTLGGTGGLIDHPHTQPQHQHTQPQHQHGWTGLTITDHPVHLHQVPIHGHADTIGMSDHAAHLHEVPIHGHADMIGFSDHAAHEHWFEDTFSTSGHSTGLVQSGSDVSRVTGTGGHTGEVGANTANGPGALAHTKTGQVTNAAAFNTENNAAAQAHTKTGAVTNAAAFNTENNAAAQAHTIGGSVALGGDDLTGLGGDESTGANNPPFLAVNFIIRVL